MQWVLAGGRPELDVRPRDGDVTGSGGEGPLRRQDVLAGGHRGKELASCAGTCTLYDGLAACLLACLLDKLLACWLAKLLACWLAKLLGLMGVDGRFRLRWLVLLVLVY